MTIATSVAGSSENFAELFNESLSHKEMRVGEVITAEIIRVDYNFVVVNAGLKSESYIPIEEFKMTEVRLKPAKVILSVWLSKHLKTDLVKPVCRETRQNA